MDARHTAAVATEVTSRRPYAPPKPVADTAARVYAFARQRANTVVIDGDGRIVDANDAWRLFSRLNDGAPDATDVGANYLEECDRAALAGSHEAGEARDGLRRLLDGDADGFDLTYQCSSTVEERWFRLQAIAAPVADGRGAVINHIDVTADRSRLARNDHTHHLDRETGLLDRTGTISALQGLLDHQRATGIASCAVRVGLVGLGGIAQHRGQAAADTALVRAASRVRFAASNFDVVGRIGPHELVVLCPSTPRQVAKAFAGRLAAVLLAPHQLGPQAITIDAAIDVVETSIHQTAEQILAFPLLGEDDQPVPLAHSADADAAQWPSAAEELGAELARRLASPNHHRIIIEALSEGILVQDTTGKVLFASEPTRELLAELDLSTMTPRPGFAIVDEHGRPLAVEHRPGRLAMSQGRPIRQAVVGIRSERAIVRWLEVNSQVAADGHGSAPFAIVSSIRDITAQRVATDRFRLQAQLLNAVSQAVAGWEADGSIVYMNDVAEEFYGWPRASAIGQNIHDIVSNFGGRGRSAQLREAMAIGEPWEGEVALPAGPTTPRIVWFSLAPVIDDGRTVGFITVASDITERKAEQSLIEHQATHDTLTDLPNRRALLDAVHAALDADETADGTADGHAISASLALISLGPLDVVNDAYGHASGDAIVLQCARELQAAAHPGDLLARFSDHAFAVLCLHGTGLDGTRGYAEDLRTAISRPFPVLGGEIHVRPAAGVAVALTGSDAAELLRHVDIALLRARKHGTTQVYDREIDARLRRELELEALVERVIASGQVTMGYQPIVGLDDEHTLGAEALLRLVDEEGQPISPIEVIEAAERSGSIIELGDLILHTACHQAARWQVECTEHPTHVSVNVSGRQLDDPGLVQRIDAALAESGLPPELLWLEITESALMEDPERSIAILDELHARGITLAADDFGTGYSSLSHLKRLPLDVVKVDRSFVSGLPDDHEDLAITRAIMALADALGLQVVAEGVEQQDQLDTLRAMGLHYGQGYLWSKAVPADAFRAFACRQRCCSI